MGAGYSDFGEGDTDDIYFDENGDNYTYVQQEQPPQTTTRPSVANTGAQFGVLSIGSKKKKKGIFNKANKQMITFGKRVTKCNYHEVINKKSTLTQFIVWCTSPHISHEDWISTEDVGAHQLIGHFLMAHPSHLKRFQMHVGVQSNQKQEKEEFDNSLPVWFHELLPNELLMLQLKFVFTGDNEHAFAWLRFVNVIKLWELMEITNKPPRRIKKVKEIAEKLLEAVSDSTFQFDIDDTSRFSLASLQKPIYHESWLLIKELVQARRDNDIQAALVLEGRLVKMDGNSLVSGLESSKDNNFSDNRITDIYRRHIYGHIQHFSVWLSSFPIATNIIEAHVGVPIARQVGFTFLGTPFTFFPGDNDGVTSDYEFFDNVVDGISIMAFMEGLYNDELGISKTMMWPLLLGFENSKNYESDLKTHSRMRIEALRDTTPILVVPMRFRRLRHLNLGSLSTLYTASVHIMQSLGSVEGFGNQLLSLSISVDKDTVGLLVDFLGNLNTRRQETSPPVLQYLHVETLFTETVAAFQPFRMVTDFACQIDGIDEFTPSEMRDFFQSTFFSRLKKFTFHFNPVTGGDSQNAQRGSFSSTSSDSDDDDGFAQRYDDDDDDGGGGGGVTAMRVEKTETDEQVFADVFKGGKHSASLLETLVLDLYTPIQRGEDVPIRTLSFPSLRSLDVELDEHHANIASIFENDIDFGERVESFVMRGIRLFNLEAATALARTTLSFSRLRLFDLKRSGINNDAFRLLFVDHRCEKLQKVSIATEYGYTGLDVSIESIQEMLSQPGRDAFRSLIIDGSVDTDDETLVRDEMETFLQDRFRANRLPNLSVLRLNDLRFDIDALRAKGATLAIDTT